MHAIKTILILTVMAIGPIVPWILVAYNKKGVTRASSKKNHHKQS